MFMFSIKYMLIISKIILLSLLVSCEDNDNRSDFDTSTELKTETIFIEQNVSGVLERRPVIIQTESNINSSKLYPVVFGLHGNCGTKTVFKNKMKMFNECLL